MNVGDIFYFVDVSVGKVLKCKITEITYRFSLNQGATIYFYGTGLGNRQVYKDNIFLNPTPENYFTSNTKLHYSSKCYLVFTEAELAQRALINYALPKKAENIQKDSDEIIKKYHEIVSKIQSVETEIKNQTEKFDNKCNALKKKFV